jgi:hypothetical protein
VSGGGGSDAWMPCSACREEAGKVRARQLTNSGGGSRPVDGHGGWSRRRNAAGRRVWGSGKEGGDMWV